jgi:O-antigen/teichoic acid export membrane protein
VPFLLSELGRTSYGIASLVGVIVSFGLIADLGLRGALGRQLAEQVARNDDLRYNQLTSTAMALYLCLGGAMAVSCFVFAPQLAHYFAGRKDYILSDDLMKQAIFLVRWFAPFNLLVTFVQPVYSASITSNNRFDLANYANIAVNLVRGLSLWLVLSLTDWQLYGWAIAMFITEAMLLVAWGLCAHRARPSLRIRPWLVTRGAMRPLFGLGGYLFIFQLTDLISVRSDPLVLSRLMQPWSLSLYNPGLSLTAVTRPIVNTLAQQLHPLTTGFHVRGQRDQLRAVLIRGTRLTWLMAIAVGVVLIVFASPIITLWLHDSMAKAMSRELGAPVSVEALGKALAQAASVLVAWALVDLIDFAGGTQWSVLLGMQRMAFLVWTQAPLAVANVIASILLVKYTSLGVLGVMLPTLASIAIRRPMVTVYTSRLIGLPLRRYLLEAYLGPLVVLAGCLAAGVAFRGVIPPTNIPLLLLDAALTVIVWTVLMWYVGLSGEDRRDLWGMLMSLLRRPKVAAAPGPKDAADTPAAGRREP